MREDVYNVLKSFHQTANLNDLDDESKRFIETSLIDAKQYGKITLIRLIIKSR